MPKSAKPNILRSELLLPDIELNPEIEAAVRRMFALMMGWDDGNEIWRLLNVDNNGRLEVSSASAAGDTGNNSAVTVTVAGQTLLANNPNRKGYIIQNNSQISVYVKFGTPASLTTGIVLNAFTSMSGQDYTGVITAITPSSSANVRIIEIT